MPPQRDAMGRFVKGSGPSLPQNKGGVVWQKDEISPNLKKMGMKFHPRMMALMTYNAQAMQDDMRVNASWTDRTSNARNGLFAKAVYDAGSRKYIIVLYHTVPYGIWLEMRWSGKYAIINPTMQTGGPQVMSDLRKFLRKVA